MKKMNIVALVLFFALIAAFAWSYIKNQKEMTMTEVEQVAIEGVMPANKEASFSGVGSLTSLREQNKNLECQIVYEQANDKPIEGTYFTSQGNIRGDFLVPAEGEGESILSSMIVGGDALYVWSTIEGEMFGFKSSISTPSQIKTKEPVPIEATVKYTCSNWGAVDGSVFVPPALVSFKDVSTVIEAGMEDGTLEP